MADKLIGYGAVLVNGKIKATLGMDIDPEKDAVTINGKPVIVPPKNESRIYIALNKPAGYITTRKDDRERQTIMELLPKIENLKPVGRLDKDTEGLILISNDGNFINRYTHPKFNCEKEYTAILEGNLSKKDKIYLENGVVIDGKITSKAQIRIIKADDRETEVSIIIYEGRKRQIRKMFMLVHHPVKHLKRLRIGKIKLESLKRGAFRHLTKEEIDAK